ncbi:MAG: Ig-like domain-containing protein [Pseudomonadota bacterium]
MVSIELVGSDANLEDLNYSVLSQPQSGSLGPPTGSTITYMPDADFTGSDVFSYLVMDASSDSMAAAVPLSSDGRVVALGIPGSDVGADDSGEARVFQFENGIWEQLGDDINDLGSARLGLSFALSKSGKVLAASGARWCRAYILRGEV